MSIFKRLIDYIKSSRLELKYVNWPNRQVTLKFTLLVVAISFATAIFLGSLDMLFTYILNRFIV